MGYMALHFTVLLTIHFGVRKVYFPKKLWSLVGDEVNHGNLESNKLVKVKFAS